MELSAKVTSVYDVRALLGDRLPRTVGRWGTLARDGATLADVLFPQGVAYVITREDPAEGQLVCTARALTREALQTGLCLALTRSPRIARRLTRDWPHSAWESIGLDDACVDELLQLALLGEVLYPVVSP